MFWQVPGEFCRQLAGAARQQQQLEQQQQQQQVHVMRAVKGTWFLQFQATKRTKCQPRTFITHALHSYLTLRNTPDKGTCTGKNRMMEPVIEL